jgi:hypothetical protein
MRYTKEEDKGHDRRRRHGLATESDVEGILDLQDRNQPDGDGTLSVRFSRGRLEAAATTMPVGVARRECVLFIRCDNTASLEAHALMGMREVAAFTHGEATFAVLSYTG